GAFFGDKNHKAFSRFCLCGHEKSGLDPHSLHSTSGIIDRLSGRADRECQEENAACMLHPLQDGGTNDVFFVENLAEP
ncbi:hypothetical protein, partial [Pseudomonas helleri]|uniref:hypothetical protein n=1 Tax=Pseudomonas helleri TaxID=1608996 RepID=UPI001E612B41